MLMATIIMLPFFFIAVFHLQKFFVKVEMQQELKYKKLVTLQIPESEIQWFKEGKEIIVEGSLFDVKSITYKNGLVTVKGLYDREEKEIYKQIDKTNESQNKSINTTLVKLLDFYFISNEQVATSYITTCNNNIPQLGCTDDYRLPVNYLSVPTPPPLG